MTIHHPGDRTIVLVLKWPNLARNRAGLPRNTSDSELRGVGAQYEVKSSEKRVKTRRFASISMQGGPGSMGTLLHHA